MPNCPCCKQPLVTQSHYQEGHGKNASFTDPCSTCIHRTKGQNEAPCILCIHRYN